MPIKKAKTPKANAAKPVKRMHKNGPSDAEITAAQDATQPYRKQINDTPALLSLLYDIDLLPEQIRLFVNVNRMKAVCELFKMIPQETIKMAMTELEADDDGLMERLRGAGYNAIMDEAAAEIERLRSVARQAVNSYPEMREALIAECIEAAAKAWPRAHTYASENADLYRAQDHAVGKVIEAIRAVGKRK